MKQESIQAYFELLNQMERSRENMAKLLKESIPYNPTQAFSVVNDIAEHLSTIAHLLLELREMAASEYRPLPTFGEGCADH